jgi:hypothetical protein
MRSILGINGPEGIPVVSDKIQLDRAKEPECGNDLH